MASVEIGMSVIKSMAHEIAQEVLEEINKEKPEIKDRVEAYDDGYQQGRADQKKEDNEFFNFDKVIEIEKNKSYQQGKADGVREFAEWLCQKSDIAYVNYVDFATATEDSKSIDEVIAEWQKGTEK